MGKTAKCVLLSVGAVFCFCGSGTSGLAGFVSMLGDRDPKLPPPTGFAHYAPLVFLGGMLGLFAISVFLASLALRIQRS